MSVAEATGTAETTYHFRVHVGHLAKLFLALYFDRLIPCICNFVTGSLLAI